MTALRPPDFARASEVGGTTTAVGERLDVLNRLGRAMADPSRARILLSLLDSPAYPSELATQLDLSRQSVSNHLTCLRGCGIVTTDPQGRQVRYAISDPHLTVALSALVSVTLAVDTSVSCTDPTCQLPGCCDGDDR